MSRTAVSVYFNNFWNGFIEKTDTMDCTFFVKLLEKAFDSPIHISSSPNDASVLIESIFGHSTLVRYKKWRFTFLFTGETNYGNIPDVNQYDCVLGFEETRGRFVKCPLYLIFLLTNKSILQEILRNDLYCNSNTAPIPSTNASIILSTVHGNERLTFLKHLEKKMTVFYGGKYNNNIGRLVSGHCNSPEMVEFYKKGKFAITMENGERPYYITEKIINGFRSGVIPVYWGSPRIGEFFNTRRFLQLKSGSQQDMDELIERMLNMTNDEYLNMVREPILVRPVHEVCDEVVESVKKILTSSSSSSS